MATIEIVDWKDPIGGTAWDEHARSELRKRLRSGLDIPLHEIRRLARRIHARQLVSLHRVREEGVLGLAQILTATGAELQITLEHGNDERLFKKWPRRGI